MARYRRSLYSRRKVNIRRLAYYVLSGALLILIVFFISRSLINKPRQEQADKEENITTTAADAAPAKVPPAGITQQPQPQPQGEQAVSGESILNINQATTGPEEPINPEAAVLIAEANSLLDSEQIITARQKLNDILALRLNSKQRSDVKKILSTLADKWLFSKKVYYGDNLCDLYEVQSGDLLVNIAQQYKVPYEILIQINNLPSARDLRAGQAIKVIKGPFHAIIYRSAFTMDLYLQNTFVRSFPVGLGRHGKETPTGLWRVKKGGKLEKPTWTDPNGRTFHPDDPDYPLGSRWIGLDGIEGQARDRTGFAIHGTKDANTIGTQSSQGCIRLFNGDAILVYNLFAEGYSLIRVVD